ncbi:MAG: glycosyltransferase family 4 protein [Clostridiales bacterium]|nr:glycosyltransferase family 4 protein [Clostridiales bacterium]
MDSDKIRVLFVENAGLLSAGAFQSLVVLIGHLREYGVESHIILPDRADAADGVRLLREKGIPFMQMRSCSYTWNIRQSAGRRERWKMPFKEMFVRLASLRAARYVRRNKITIIHENTSACYMGMYVARLTGARHVWHIREFMEEDFHMEFRNRKQAIRLFRRSDAVIAISGAIFRKYAGELDQERLHLIYNGVPGDRFYKPEKKIFEEKVPLILCAGRINPGKGQDILIRAVGILKQRASLTVRVKLAGACEPDLYEKLYALAAECGVEDEVEFLGHCNDMPKLYEQSDIYCMCSRCEAFGRVTVEAMMSGDLVIGSDSGGTSEVIRHGQNGLLFEPGNAEDLARQLLYALGHRQEMKKLADAGRTEAMKKYESGINARHVYELYRSL